MMEAEDCWNFSPVTCVYYPTVGRGTQRQFTESRRSQDWFATIRDRRSRLCVADRLFFAWVASTRPTLCTTDISMKTVLTLALLLSLPVIAFGRIRPVWTYERMYDNSDLVVIAKPVASTQLEEKMTLPNISPAILVVGVETQLDVRLVLKGEPKTKTIALHHYALQKPADGLTRGAPQLVSFDPKQPVCYLMFLKREANDRYAPVTGQTDPAAESVIELESSAR
jgi:hypothetical protein